MQFHWKCLPIWHWGRTFYTHEHAKSIYWSKHLSQPTQSSNHYFMHENNSMMLLCYCILVRMLLERLQVLSLGEQRHMYLWMTGVIPNKQTLHTSLMHNTQTRAHEHTYRHTSIQQVPFPPTQSLSQHMLNYSCITCWIKESRIQHPQR